MKFRVKWSLMGLAIWLVATLALQTAGLSLLTSHLVAGVVSIVLVDLLARGQRARKSPDTTPRG